MITLTDFEQAGIDLSVSEVKTVANVLIRRNSKEPNEWPLSRCINYLADRVRQIAEKKEEEKQAKAALDNEKIKPRPATKKDLDKSRTRIQTSFRRGVKGKLQASCRAEGKTLSCRSSGSKERVKPSAKKPDGWNTTSQGAGNVVGARENIETVANDSKGLTFMF